MNLQYKQNVRIAVEDTTKKLILDDYMLLRLACYNPTNDTGDKEATVELTVCINGEIDNIIEQKQLNLPNTWELDPALAGYFVANAFEEPESLKLFKEEGNSNAGLVDVDLKFVVSTSEQQ